MEKYQKLFDQVHIELEKAQHIMLVIHKNPDGDATGASLALSHFLEKNNKNHTCFSKDKLGSNFAFLPKNDVFNHDEKIWKNNDFDLIITLDSSNLDHTGVEPHINNHKNRVKIINIDHHITNEKHGHINLVVSEASSTCEIVHYLLDAKKAINKAIATCLLTGIITDTDGFQNMATTPSAIETASRLMKKGVNIGSITKLTLDQKPVNTLKLWGMALQRLKINKKNNVISTVVTRQDLIDCNASEEALDGIANFLNRLNEAENGVVMVLSEHEPGKIKGSLRTTNPLIDVSKLANILGGGGHKKASGFSIEGKLEETDDGWQIV